MRTCEPLSPTPRRRSRRPSIRRLALGFGLGLLLWSLAACQNQARPALPGRIAIALFGELNLIDLAQGSVAPLPVGGQVGGDVIDPAWSPDGREIAFVRQSPPRPGDPVPLGRATLQALDPATGQTRTIWDEPAGGLIHEPAWAPDGQSLYYARVEHRFDGPRYQGYQEMIMKVGRDGQNPTRVIVDATAPAPSPDGRSLVFVAREPGGREPGLWHLDLASGATKHLLPAPAPVELNGPVYSPDGRTIALAASALAGGDAFQTARRTWDPPAALAHGLPSDVWLIEPNGANPRQFTKLSEDRFLPAWSPDGQAIAALGQGGLFFFDLTGKQIARFEKIAGEGSTTWGKLP